MVARPHENKSCSRCRVLNGTALVATLIVLNNVLVSVARATSPPGERGKDGAINDHNYLGQITKKEKSKTTPILPALTYPTGPMLQKKGYSVVAYSADRL